MRKQQGTASHPGGDECRFSAGMTATDHDDVEIGGEKHEGSEYTRSAPTGLGVVPEDFVFHVEPSGRRPFAAMQQMVSG